MQNLEIKIRLSQGRLECLEAFVREAGLLVAVLNQIDTYYAVPQGRLKLREITPAAGERSAELIAYLRPDESGPRWSTYQLLPLGPDVGPGLKDMLAATIGVTAVVAKRRAVAIRGRSRIHLDQVEALGCFLEIETVTQDGGDTGIDQELRATLEWLGVDLRIEEPIRGSYADLLHQPG